MLTETFFLILAHWGITDSELITAATPDEFYVYRT